MLEAETNAVALVDSGASHSFISQAVVERYSLPVHPGENMEVTLADGHLVAS